MTTSPLPSEDTLLSEDDSALLAGISVETLRQYTKFGLLTPVSGDGTAFYAEREIRTLFYTKPRPKPEEPLLEPLAEGEEIELTTVDKLLGSKRGEQEPSQPPSTDAEEKPSSSASGNAEAAAQEEATGSEARPQMAAEMHQGPAAYELSEVNRSLREQIEILREERNWLRERVEKLESRSEREQMLLLAESETVRNLLHTEKKPRNLWNFALPWFGFTKEQ